MAFDINKYEKEVFHEDEGISNKIKVLLLWFEYQVFVNKVPMENQIGLIDNILNLCVKQEWYEIAVFFKNKKIELLKK